MTVVYKSSEVMKLLNLKELVFKKYVSLIGKEGFVFQKNSQGHRMFSELVVQRLETFIKLSRYDGVTLESVAKKVAEWRNNKGHDDMIGKEIQDQDNVNPQESKSHDVMTLVDSLLREFLANYWGFPYSSPNVKVGVGVGAGFFVIVLMCF